jgi:hypothetical protein
MMNDLLDDPWLVFAISFFLLWLSELVAPILQDAPETGGSADQ